MCCLYLVGYNILWRTNVDSLTSPKLVSYGTYSQFECSHPTTKPLFDKWWWVYHTVGYLYKVQIFAKFTNWGLARKIFSWQSQTTYIFKCREFYCANNFLIVPKEMRLIYRRFYNRRNSCWDTSVVSQNFGPRNNNPPYSIKIPDFSLVNSCRPKVFLHVSILTIACINEMSVWWLTQPSFT